MRAEASDSEVDTALATMAGRMRMSAEQLTQALAKSGVNAATLKHRIRADIVWPQLVRGRYQASLQIGEKEIIASTEPKTDDVGYDYYLRPILSSCLPDRPKHSLTDGAARRKHCARVFRAARKVSPSCAH